MITAKMISHPPGHYFPEFDDEPPDSGAEPAAPVNVDAPYVSGTPAAGETLACTTGNWDNAPTSYGYAWRRGNWQETEQTGMALIPGATGPTYTAVSDDIGAMIDAAVIATNAAGSATSPPSNQVGPVAKSLRGAQR